MKIAFDSGPMGGDNATRGIGVYAKNLYNSLFKISERNKFQVTLVDFKSLNNNEKFKFDLVHIPSFDLFFHTLPINKVIPTVVTIHDTTPLLYPAAYPPGIRGSLKLTLQKISLRNVSAVVTDSETSKKDIIRNLSVTPEKITPIYLGPTINKKYYSKSKNNDLKVKYKLPDVYIVYVGDVNYNKNLVSLCEACVSSNTHLVIVGKRAVLETFDRANVENLPIITLLKKYGDNKFIHRVGFVPDEDLPNVIKMALFLVQPSLYEGFGLGVLDAMSLGVPTLCGKTQTLVEIYEKGSIFASPKEVSSIKEKIIELKQNKQIRDELSKKGLRLSKNFSWTKTAEQTYEVYRRVLSSK